MRALGILEVGSPRQDDFAAMARVHQRSYVDTYTNVTPEITPEAVDYHLGGDWLERQEAKYRDRYSSGEAALAVARTGGVVVGFCMVDHDLWGGALYVEPDYQRGFVGPALVWAMKDVVADRSVGLTVVPNIPAVAFYERLGFTQIHDAPIEPVFLRGGQELPQIQMSITPEAMRQTIQRAGQLFERRDGLVFTD